MKKVVSSPRPHRKLVDVPFIWETPELNVDFDPYALWHDRIATWFSLFNEEDPAEDVIGIKRSLYQFLTRYAPPRDEDICKFRIPMSPFTDKNCLYYREEGVSLLDKMVEMRFPFLHQTLEDGEIVVFNSTGFKRAFQRFTTHFDHDQFSEIDPQIIAVQIQRHPLFNSSREHSHIQPILVCLGELDGSEIGHFDSEMLSMFEKRRDTFLDMMVMSFISAELSDSHRIEWPTWVREDQQIEIFDAIKRKITALVIEDSLNLERLSTEIEAVLTETLEPSQIQDLVASQEMLDRFSVLKQTTAVTRYRELSAKIRLMKRQNTMDTRHLEEELVQLGQHPDYQEYTKLAPEVRITRLSRRPDFRQLISSLDCTMLADRADWFKDTFVCYFTIQDGPLTTVVTPKVPIHFSDKCVDIRGRAGLMPSFGRILSCVLGMEGNLLLPCPSSNSVSPPQTPDPTELLDQLAQLDFTDLPPHRQRLMAVPIRLMLNSAVAESMHKVSETARRFISEILGSILDVMGAITHEMPTDQFYDQFQLVLENTFIAISILSPYSAQALHDSVQGPISQHLSRPVECHFASSGMNALFKAFDWAVECVGTPKIGFGFSSYFESSMLCSYLDQNSLLDEDIFTDRVVEIGESTLPRYIAKRNILLFDIGFNNARLTTMKRVNIPAEVQQVDQQGKLAEKAVLIIDATLTHFMSDTIRSIVEDPYIDRLIQEGRLAVIFVQSGIKLYGFGMAKVNLGPMLGVYRHDAFPSLHEQMSDTVYPDVPIESIAWYTSLFESCLTLQTEYLDQISENARNIYKYLPESCFYSPNDFSSVVQISRNLDQDQFILAFNFENFVDRCFTSVEANTKEEYVQQLCAMMIDVISDYATRLSQHHDTKSLRVVKQDSFGFLRSNIGDCVDTIRVTIGYAPEDIPLLIDFTRWFMALSKSIFNEINWETVSKKDNIIPTIRVILSSPVNIMLCEIDRQDPGIAIENYLTPYKR